MTANANNCGFERIPYNSWRNNCTLIYCLEHKKCYVSLFLMFKVEKGMATHSSIPAWRILWTEEPGGLQSIGSQRVGHDRNDLAHTHRWIGSVQLLSRVWLCDPVDSSTPGFPVHHLLPELAQTHIHRVGDAIQPSHSLSSPSPPAFNLSQHQGLF